MNVVGENTNNGGNKEDKEKFPIEHSIIEKVYTKYFSIKMNSERSNFRPPFESFVDPVMGEFCNLKSTTLPDRLQQFMEKCKRVKDAFDHFHFQAEQEKKNFILFSEWLQDFDPELNSIIRKL